MGKLIKVNGKLREVISEKLITGYPIETNKEMKARQKKGLPLGKYSYIAVKTKGQKDE
jgi:hypothetical protein